MPLGEEGGQGEGPSQTPWTSLQARHSRRVRLEPGIPESRSFSDTGFLWDLCFPVMPKEKSGSRKVRALTVGGGCGWVGQTAGTPPPGSPDPGHPRSQTGVWVAPMSKHRSGWQVGEPRHVASKVSRGSWERTCQP